jgi:hypothetical protein
MVLRQHSRHRINKTNLGTSWPQLVREEVIATIEAVVAVVVVVAVAVVVATTT